MRTRGVISDRADAVLLDAMGTLIELAPPAPRLRQEISRRFGISLRAADVERALRAEIAYYRAHLNEGRDGDSLRALHRRCAEVIRDALPALADIPTDSLTQALLASLQFRVFPEVPDALRALQDRGLRLVVVSNWDVSLHEVLARVGLAPALDGIITSAEAGAPKPSPVIFERALKIARTTADRAVHVGDSPAEDIAGARAAGIEAVLIYRRGGVDGLAERVIRSLSEL